MVDDKDVLLAEDADWFRVRQERMRARTNKSSTGEGLGLRKGSDGDANEGRRMMRTFQGEADADGGSGRDVPHQ